MAAKPYLKVKAELIQATKDVAMKCPDEILRYHYGIITHSDAGKNALNQYFGHWVHAYGHYMMYSADILDMIRKLAGDPDFQLVHCKKMWLEISKPPTTPNLLVHYGGQKTLGHAIDQVAGVLDTLKTKEEFLDLLKAFQSLVTRLYWWFHWYFPWGVGPVLCRRMEPEDVKEMARLAGIKA